MMENEYDLSLAPSSQIEQVSLVRTEGGLTLTLNLSIPNSIESRCLIFHGVKSLRFRGEHTMLTEWITLVAQNIAAWGWEDSKFRVKDIEEEFISFFCREIESHPAAMLEMVRSEK